MDDVVTWLESPEGEFWSRIYHKRTTSQEILVSIKSGGRDDRMLAIILAANIENILIDKHWESI